MLFPLCSRGKISLGAHDLLRFRANDVLLGTLGVGVRICGVSNSPIKCSTAMLYRFFESKLHPQSVSLRTGDEQRPSIHRVAASLSLA